MIDNIKNYIQSSMVEMKKVTWPTKKETYNYTLAVIGVSLFVAALLGGLDYIYSFALQILLNR